MAETSSGWLKPEDGSREGADRRAIRLLGDFLDEDQRDQAQRFGGFAVEAGGRVFWIPLEGTPWCAFPDDGRVQHLCIAPDERRRMPDGDVTLTYLLWIKSAPDDFLREANALETTTLEWPDSYAELVRALAKVAAPRPAPPARPRPRRKKTKPTHGICLDPERVRALFERHGKAIDDDLLRKLTR